MLGEGEVSACWVKIRVELKRLRINIVIMGKRVCGDN